MKTSTCRSCGAPVIWAVTASGKRMPVDAEPVEGGNVRLDDVGLPDPQAVVFGGFSADHADTLHKSHFATCVNAAQHRRPRR